VRRKHHDLLAWRRSVDLVKLVYSATAGFPASELYGLTGQMRRAAVSVPANIAEGVARTGSKERIHYLVIARGSLNELDTHATIARELGFLRQTEELDSTIDSVAALLGGLINAERRKTNQT
jgi:four helix bundle protein